MQADWTWWIHWLPYLLLTDKSCTTWYCKIVNIPLPAVLTIPTAVTFCPSAITQLLPVDSVNSIHRRNPQQRSEHEQKLDSLSIFHVMLQCRCIRWTYYIAIHGTFRVRIADIKMNTLTWTNGRFYRVKPVRLDHLRSDHRSIHLTMSLNRQCLGPVKSQSTVLELWEIAPNSPPETAAPICILHIWSVVLHWELTKCSNWWSFALFRLAQIAGFAELSLTSNDISCQDDSRWMFWSTDFPYKK